MFLNKTMMEGETEDYELFNDSCKRFYDCRYTTMSDFEKQKFWISGIILVIFGAVGVLGNSFTIAVLCQQRMRKNTFYNLLVILACFDTLYILTFGTGKAYDSLVCYPCTNQFVIDKLVIWSEHFIAGSVYMTVAISLERYLGICHPHIQFSRRSLVFILPVLLFSSTYRFLIRLIKNYIPPRLFRLWTPIIVGKIIPIMALILLNGLIIATVRRSRNLMRTNVRQEQNTIKILFSIVLVFLLLHLPRFLVFLHWYWYLEEPLRPVSILALVINSSINFVIYALVGRNFREELIRIFKSKTTFVSNTSSSGCGEVLSLENF